MPMSPFNTRMFTRRLFAGMFKTIEFRKRGDDQLEGTVTVYTLYNIRRSRYSKTGEPIQGDMPNDVRTVWHIPAVELERVGINYVNVCDQIVERLDDQGRPYPNGPHWWQPESPQIIDIKMFSNEIDIACVRIDPTIIIDSVQPVP